MKRLHWSCLTLLLAAAPVAAGDAQPTVAEVLAACERTSAAGHQGVDAALCDWFTTPCDCGPQPNDQHWCVPPEESPAATTRKVLARLRGAPDRQAPAAGAVAAIMASLYPCPAAP